MSDTDQKDVLLPYRGEVTDLKTNQHIYVLRAWRTVRDIQDIDGARLVSVFGSPYPFYIKDDAVLWTQTESGIMTPPVEEQEEEENK